MTTERTREELIHQVNRRIDAGLEERTVRLDEAEEGILIEWNPEHDPVPHWMIGSATSLMQQDLSQRPVLGKNELLVFASIEEVHSILPDLQAPPAFDRHERRDTMDTLAHVKDALGALAAHLPGLRGDKYLESLDDPSTDQLAGNVQAMDLALGDMLNKFEDIERTLLTDHNIKIEDIDHSLD